MRSVPTGGTERNRTRGDRREPLGPSLRGHGTVGTPQRPSTTPHHTPRPRRAAVSRTPRPLGERTDVPCCRRADRQTDFKPYSGGQLGTAGRAGPDGCHDSARRSHGTLDNSSRSAAASLHSEARERDEKRTARTPQTRPSPPLRPPPPSGTGAALGRGASRFSAIRAFAFARHCLALRCTAPTAYRPAAATASLCPAVTTLCRVAFRSPQVGGVGARSPSPPGPC